MIVVQLVAATGKGVSIFLPSIDFSQLVRDKYRRNLGRLHEALQMNGAGPEGSSTKMLPKT